MRDCLERPSKVTHGFSEADVSVLSGIMSDCRDTEDPADTVRAPIPAQLDFILLISHGCTDSPEGMFNRKCHFFQEATVLLPGEKAPISSGQKAARWSFHDGVPTPL